MMITCWKPSWYNFEDRHGNMRVAEEKEDEAIPEKPGLF
jgi:hypothetical protein